jgi:ketosteroid isomerase-like protein
MHPNEALARRELEVVQAGDIAALGNLHADDFVLHYPGRNPLAGDHRGTHEYLAKIQPLIGERRHAHASSTTLSEATITPCSS